MALLVMIVLGFMLGFTHLPWILVGVLVVIPFIHDKIIARKFVEWNDDMSVGIDLIDHDHKKLLGLINQLQTAIQYQTDDQLTDKALEELVVYTNRSGVRATCPDCHVPKDWEHNVIRKISATNERFHKAIGSISTKEKFDPVTLKAGQVPC